MQDTQGNSPNILTRISIIIPISLMVVVYAHLRWGKLPLLSGGLFIAGCLIFYFSIRHLISFINHSFHSAGTEKAYTIKSIAYLIVIWGIVLASGQSYWRFEAQHEIGVCPGWSDNIEEISYPILRKVVNQETGEVFPITQFLDKNGEQHIIPDGLGLEIQDCVFYRHTDFIGLKKVMFRFISGSEYLPVQVTANDVGAVLDLGAGDEVRMEVILTPDSAYNLTWLTLLQYLERWALLLCLVVVFALYSLFLIHRFLSATERLLGRTLSPVYIGLMVVQSGVIAVWLVRKINFEWYLSAIIWFLLTILITIGLGYFINRIFPAAEDAKTQSKVILFAFCTSIVLSLFIPIQPSGLFGIVSPATSTNVLYNIRLLGKIVLLDLILLGIFSFLTDTQKQYRPNSLLPRWWMLIYALPLAAVGVVMLLAFFPGIMSQDSLNQWIQLSNFKFEPWHPIFHTMLNWLVTRVWMSPAAIASAQILGLSLTVGYALYRFEKEGLPKQLIGSMAIVAAIVPVNAFYMVTLWKDIPFAIVYVWLTILLYEIYSSYGRWVIELKNVLLLGTLIACAALLRYNGLIEMFFLIFLLVIIYKGYWKRWVLVGMMAMTIVTLTNFAIDRYLPKADPLGGKSTQGALARIIEHHVRAHVHLGTEIHQTERRLLSQTMPSLTVYEHYTCHTSLTAGFYYAEMLFDPDKMDELIQVYLMLASRAPWVEVRHQICNLSNIWRVFPRVEENMYLVPVRVRSGSGELVYQVPEKYAELAGVSQDSKIPVLAEVLGEYISKTSKETNLFVAPWRIAPYVYILIVGLVFRAMIYEKDLRFLIIGGPAFTHLVLFTFSNLFVDFRYHYMIVLVACILGPLLFLRGSLPRPTGK